MIRSEELRPGQRLRHRDGAVVTLACRKREDDGRGTSLPFHPGWWLEGGGGLADFVLERPDSSGWEVLP